MTPMTQENLAIMKIQKIFGSKKPPPRVINEDIVGRLKRDVEN